MRPKRHNEKKTASKRHEWSATPIAACLRRE